MSQRRRRNRKTIMSSVLTLRLTQEEMLRFKVAALTIGRKRAQLVRERVADLIGGTPRVEGTDGALIGKATVATSADIPLEKVKPAVCPKPPDSQVGMAGVTIQ